MLLHTYSDMRGTQRTRTSWSSRQRPARSDAAYGHPQCARMMRIGRNHRGTIWRQLRETRQHHARNSRIIERMRLIAYQCQSDKWRIGCANIYRQIGIPKLTSVIELRREPNHVDAPWLGCRFCSAAFFERDAEIRFNRVRKMVSTRNKSKIS